MKTKHDRNYTTGNPIFPTLFYTSQYFASLCFIFFSFLLQKSLEKCRSDLQLKNNVIRQLISQSENATFTSHQNLNGVNYSYPLTQTDSMRMR